MSWNTGCIDDLEDTVTTVSVVCDDELSCVDLNAICLMVNNILPGQIDMRGRVLHLVLCPRGSVAEFVGFDEIRVQ